MFISRDVSPPAHQFAVTKGKTSHRRGSPSDRQAARAKFSILTSDLNPFRVIFGRQTLQDREVLFFADDHEMDALAELPQRFDELGGDRQAAFDGIGSFIEALDHRGWNMNAGNFFVEKMSHSHGTQRNECGDNINRQLPRDGDETRKRLEIVNRLSLDESGAGRDPLLKSFQLGPERLHARIDGGAADEVSLSFQRMARAVIA